MSDRTVVCVCVCVFERGKEKGKGGGGRRKRRKERNRVKSIAYNNKKKKIEGTHLLLCFLEYRRYTKSI